jgi:mitochondrial fission protein ELM1
VLLGDKTGDNEQCLALADALGWPYETRRLAYNRRYRRWNVRLGARLSSLDRARSEALAPPWPDLVVAIGRRSVPVTRWIQRQNAGRTRLVQLGRPRAPLAWFDLVVTTPQYAVPERANVVTLTLPPTRRRIADCTTEAAWRGVVDALPRPRIAVVVGGSGDPFTVDETAAARLAEEASALAVRTGGSLLVTTSRRTDARAYTALRANLRAPHALHHWMAGDAVNPYPLFLAEADRFVVTGDSVSLLADALATGRPVALFPGSYRPGLLHRLRQALQAFGPLHRWANEIGLVAWPRRLDRLHRALLASGQVTLLGGGEATLPRAAPAVDELVPVLARIRQLLEATSA